MKFTNNHDISLPIAVWLGNDDYKGYSKDEFNISATSLLKSTRQIVLGRRMEKGVPIEVDVSTRLASQFGTSLHKAVEEVWTRDDKPYVEVMQKMGYPPALLDKIVINPLIAPGEHDEEIGLYFEIRTNRQLGKWTITGEADMLFNGRVHDVKSTGTFSWTSRKMDDKYIKQMSIYAWLNPDKVWESFGSIEFIFKDWSANKALNDSTYPNLPVKQRNLPLLDAQQTERFILDKVADIELHLNTPEPELPYCTPEDLWQDPVQYKYYAKPESVRATKNFGEDGAAAMAHMGLKGKGEVREIPSKAKCCAYCPAATECGQFQELQSMNLV